jgi:putative membrane protein
MNVVFRGALAASAALVVAACGQQEPDAVGSAQDAASVPVGQTSAAVMGANMVSAYVPNAAMGDMYEIQAADIALERTQNAQIRELAQMIKTDHTAASEAMKPLAAQAAPDVEIPTGLDERRQGLIDNLRSASAEAFDRTWIDQQVAAHQEALTLHRGFADNTDAPALAEHARTVAPRIEAHLQGAQRLQSGM